MAEHARVAGLARWRGQQIARTRAVSAVEQGGTRGAEASIYAVERRSARCARIAGTRIGWWAGLRHTNTRTVADLETVAARLARDPVSLVGLARIERVGAGTGAHPAARLEGVGGADAPLGAGGATAGGITSLIDPVALAGLDAAAKRRFTAVRIIGTGAFADAAIQRCVASGATRADKPRARLRDADSIDTALTDRAVEAIAAVDALTAEAIGRFGRTAVEVGKALCERLGLDASPVRRANTAVWARPTGCALGACGGERVAGRRLGRATATRIAKTDRRKTTTPDAAQAGSADILFVATVGTYAADERVGAGQARSAIGRNGTGLTSTEARLASSAEQIAALGVTTTGDCAARATVAGREALAEDAAEADLAPSRTPRIARSGAAQSVEHQTASGAEPSASAVPREHARRADIRDRHSGVDESTRSVGGRRTRVDRWATVGLVHAIGLDAVESAVAFAAARHNRRRQDREPPNRPPLPVRHAPASASNIDSTPTYHRRRAWATRGTCAKRAGRRARYGRDSRSKLNTA